jgi:hypothetical protein
VQHTRHETYECNDLDSIDKREVRAKLGLCPTIHHDSVLYLDIIDPLVVSFGFASPLAFVNDMMNAMPTMTSML